LTTLLLSLLFFSCNRETGEGRYFLGMAEKAMTNSPDSALQALNSILSPEDLNKDLFNKYNLLLIQAKDKCYQDITGDSVIFSIKEYYTDKRDPQNAALAAFYCARVLHEQKKEIGRTFKAYSTAIELATKTRDYNLMGLAQGNLGILYREHSLYEEAIAMNRKAAEMYEKAGNYKNKTHALSLMGNCFLLNNRVDSAFRYYNECIKFSDQYGITELQSSVRQSKGVAYRKAGDYRSAKEWLNDALTFLPDSIEQARIFMSIAKVYLAENKTDSAKYYLNQALDMSLHEPKLVRTSFSILSQTEENEGHYLQALKHYKEYHNYTFKVFDSDKNNKLMEIQQKYDFEKFKSTKNALIIKQRGALLILLYILLIACVLILFFYRESIQNKKFLLEAECKIISLSKMAKEYSGEKQSSKAIILQYFNILRKAALIGTYLTEDERKSGQGLLKKFNKLVYEQDSMDWEKLFQVMNQFKDGFYNKIRENYPQLKDMEFRICCLSCETDFTDMEISVITGKSVDMVRRLRSNVRKKIGMGAYQQDFYSFLLQKLSDK
jgi:tetratricopeptide (TPR) repeat protein